MQPTLQRTSYTSPPAKMSATENLVNREVLVVEDETEIRELLSLLLLRQGHRVRQCSTALEALALLNTQNFDLILLDWMLPQMSGIEFLRVMPKKDIPVLMVTAKAEPSNIVEGLEAGADDYISKPFEPSILVARVRALLRRRAPTPMAQDILKIGNVTMDTNSHEVKVNGEIVHFTPSEFKIMLEMLAARGKVLTRDQLIEVVQGEGISVTGRTIDTHVFGLRKKLGSEGDWIETIRGIGYRVRVE